MRGKQAAMSEILTVSSVTKSFGAIEALRGVSFTLAKGEVRALCGENGAGKSTFVKILMGVYRPDSGTIAVNGAAQDIRTPNVAQGLGLALVAQELSLAPHLSILDNIWLGSQRVPFFHRVGGLRRDAKEALALLGAGEYDLDQSVGTLTIGQRQIVEIARLIARDAQVLVLDEPTATLSDVEIARIFEAIKALKAEGRSVLYITHRLNEVFEICDSVSIFRNGAHVITKPTSEVSREGLIEHMLGRKLGEMYPDPHVIKQSQPPLLVESLSVPGAVHNFSMIAERGEIVCIAGQVGSGAQRVVRSLAGLVPDASGRVVVAGRPLKLSSAPASVKRGIFFISEDRAGEGVFLNRSVLENLIPLHLRKTRIAGLLSWWRLREIGRVQAARVRVDRAKHSAPARDLSGGNQQKLLFGRAIDPTDPAVNNRTNSSEQLSAPPSSNAQSKSSSPSILLMNEPTRGVDVGARSEIYQIMREFCDRGCCIVMTSSDLEEVVGMADTVITMFRGSKVAQYRRVDISMARILADITHPEVRPADAA
jgi:ABC-type sugar transport system ATPase subunit